MVLSVPSQARAELAKRELARRNLFDFFRGSWSILEPGTSLLEGWYQHLICEYLMLVGEGAITRLLINIPPRYGKSTLATICFPCWMWLRQPESRWLFASYSQSLSTKHSLDRRSLIQSEWYQCLARGAVTLSADSNLKTEFTNTIRGAMVATSFGGTVTGKGADVLVVDDPHNPKGADSDKQRESALRDFDLTLSTRLNNKKTGAIVVIMQRLHQQDLSGHILSDIGGYEHLCLPAEAPTRVEIAFPRSGKQIVREAGDLLHPEREGRAELDQMKLTLGSYGYAGQYAQTPAPLGGGMVKLPWFRRYTVPPANLTRIIQSWDCAASAKELASYWVCTTWGELDNNYYLIDLFRSQMQYPDGKRMTIALAKKHNLSAVLIEDKSTGQALIPELQQAPDFSYSVIAIQPDRDKVTRMSVETPAIEAGRVWIPQMADWLPDFELEVSTFPLGATADIVDSMSQYLRYVRLHATEHWLSVYSMR